jgi:hypothetical protein
MDSLASQSPLPLDQAVSRCTFMGHKSYREKKPGCIKYTHSWVINLNVYIDLMERWIQEKPLKKCRFKMVKRKIINAMHQEQSFMFAGHPVLVYNDFILISVVLSKEWSTTHTKNDPHGLISIRALSSKETERSPRWKKFNESREKPI